VTRGAFMGIAGFIFLRDGGKDRIGDRGDGEADWA